MKKLKRAIIKEEYVELTGSFISALILQQFLYWTDRMNDVDTWVEEETARQQKKMRKATLNFHDHMDGYTRQQKTSITN